MFLVASQKNVVKWEFLLDQRELDRGLRKTQKGFKKTDQESTTLEKGMVKLKQAAVGLGLALGAREVLQFGKDTVQAASDYNESVNAIEVATGDAAAEIQRFGLTADTALGLSKTAVNEMAVTFSAFAQNIAGDGGDAAEVFQEFSTRASDMASVLNIDVSEALQKMQSGLAGESEPLRALGIDLSASAVNAHALAKGMTAAGETMTEGEKQAARYSLLMQETSKFQGDFANTADSAANQQRVLNAEWENAKVALGQGMIPVMEKALPLLVEVAQSVGKMPADLAVMSDD